MERLLENIELLSNLGLEKRNKTLYNEIIRKIEV